MLNGRPLPLTRTDARARHHAGIGHIPEARQAEGLVIDFAAWENTAFGYLCGRAVPAHAAGLCRVAGGAGGEVGAVSDPLWPAAAGGGWKTPPRSIPSVSVTRLRWSAIATTGLLTGLAGAYLSTGLSAGFVREMTAGRGYIALAALICANWHPWRALGATFLFGVMEAIANRFPDPDMGPFTIPSMFMNALPYSLTVIILAGFIGRAHPPRASGIPCIKEHCARQAGLCQTPVTPQNLVGSA